MEELLEALRGLIVRLLGTFFTAMIVGVPFMLGANSVFWEYSLPTFGYWVYVCITYAILALFTKKHLVIKEEE